MHTRGTEAGGGHAAVVQRDRGRRGHRAQRVIPRGADVRSRRRKVAAAVGTRTRGAQTGSGHTAVVQHDRCRRGHRAQRVVARGKDGRPCRREIAATLGTHARGAQAGGGHAAAVHHDRCRRCHRAQRVVAGGEDGRPRRREEATILGAHALGAGAVSPDRTVGEVDRRAQADGIGAVRPRPHGRDRQVPGDDDTFVCGPETAGSDAQGKDRTTGDGHAGSRIAGENAVRSSAPRLDHDVRDLDLRGGPASNAVAHIAFRQERAVGNADDTRTSGANDGVAHLARHVDPHIGRHDLATLIGIEPPDVGGGGVDLAVGDLDPGASPHGKNGMRHAVHAGGAEREPVTNDQPPARRQKGSTDIAGRSDGRVGDGDARSGAVGHHPARFSRLRIDHQPACHDLAARLGTEAISPLRRHRATRQVDAARAGGDSPYRVHVAGGADRDADARIIAARHTDGRVTGVLARYAIVRAGAGRHVDSSRRGRGALPVGYFRQNQCRTQ